MRYVIPFLLLTSEAFACTAGGRPCDEVYREQLQTIDKNRKENMERGELIEKRRHELRMQQLEREHALEMKRIKMRQEQEAARNKK